MTNLFTWPCGVATASFAMVLEKYLSTATALQKYLFQKHLAGCLPV